MILEEREKIEHIKNTGHRSTYIKVRTEFEGFHFYTNAARSTRVLSFLKMNIVIYSKLK